MHVLVDKEDEVEVVKDNYTRFQQMYQPIWRETFGSAFSMEYDRFEINHDDATRRFLMSHINDNVFQNIDKKMSVRSYDQEQKYHKSAMQAEKKQEVIEEIIKESHEKIENE